MKTFIYIAGCALVFILIVKAYDISSTKNSANVFEWNKSVKLYYVDMDKKSSKICKASIPVTIEIPNAETLAPGAMEALISGSRQNGFYNAINPETRLQSFEIDNFVAKIDFSSDLIKGADSCGKTAIKSQIENTLKELPDIRSVLITINGKSF